MAAAGVRDRLLHIARSLAAIEGYWDGKTFLDFEANEPLRAATERHLLIISEAVRHIPQSDKDTHALRVMGERRGAGAAKQTLQNFEIKM